MLQELKEYAGWYLLVNVRGRLFRKESSTCGYVGTLPTRWVGGEEESFKEMRQVGSLLGYLTAGKNCFYCMTAGQLSRYSQEQDSCPATHKRRTVVPLLTSAASAPWRPSHAVVGMLHTKSSPRQ